MIRNIETRTSHEADSWEPAAFSVAVNLAEGLGGQAGSLLVAPTADARFFVNCLGDESPQTSHGFCEVQATVRQQNRNRGGLSWAGLAP